MPINYGNLDLPKEGEVSLADVVEQLKIPRRTVLRYAEVFGDFLPNAVRQPPLDKPKKRGCRRILYFEAAAVDILPNIRDLSRRRLPHDGIRRKLVESKGRIISSRTKEKIVPFVRELKKRENSLPKLKKLPTDFDYAPVAQGVKVIEDEFDFWLPVDVKQVGEDRMEKIFFLINILFSFHLVEKLSGDELEIQMRDYLEGVHVTTEQGRELRDWLSEKLGLTGRWSKKNRFVVDQLAYELIERGEMNFMSVRELFERCAKRIMVSHLVSVPEIKKLWLILLDVVWWKRELVVRFGVTDDAIDEIVKIFKQRIDLDV